MDAVIRSIVGTLPLVFALCTGSLFVTCSFCLSSAGLAVGKSAFLRPGRSFIACGGHVDKARSSKRFLSSTGTSEMLLNVSSESEDSPVSFASSYSSLLNYYEPIIHLRYAQAVLEYDQLVFMPSKAANPRGSQLAAMATIIHEKSTHPDLDRYIRDAERELSSACTTDGINERQIVVQLAREEYNKLVCIPATLQAKRAMLSCTAHTAWVQARSSNNFSFFAPTLQECFDVSSETAQAIMVQAIDSPSSLNASQYSVLINEYERGMTVERIDSLFSEIQSALVPFLRTVLTSASYQQQCVSDDIDDLLNGPNCRFPIAQQQALSQQIVTALGYDLSRGRIDVSVHPFSQSLCPADVRITSRFKDTEWYQGLAGSIHEAGHAMYEQNLVSNPESVNITLADTYLSMGCHESQSLFWERHVSLSKSFWKWASPKVSEAFGMNNIGWEQFYCAVNRVSPGLIRVTADELTYPLHVILRFQIERDLIEGELAVSDIPTRWNSGMQQLLNITVPSDSEGCLQDVHWSSLAIGYFPTYLIGSAAAAQLAFYCRRDLPDFDELIEHGNFVPIKEWLTKKVHRHGRRYSSLDSLFTDQLGEALNPKYYISYLTEKYTDIYL
jgi:carboxypeptidase Taq